MSDITLWTIGRMLPLLGISLTAAYVGLFARTQTGVVYLVLIAAILTLVYGALTGTEMLVRRL